MEIRDLYDENRILTGETIIKGKTYPANRRILVVAIIIQNSKGEFLIQKRSVEKDGKWATTGGHPKAGETSLEGIITEVKEEIGLDIDNPIMFYTDGDDKVFCDLYYLKKDINLKDLKLQKEEVETVKWLSLDEIKQLVLKDEFKYSHLEMLKHALNYLKIDYNL